MMTLPIKLLLPMTFKLPPIYVFPLIPTPPATTRAPVPVLVEGVVLFTYTFPALKLTSPVNVLDTMPVPVPTKLPII